jgi:uncharacterized protein (TIGR03663 family)
MSAADTSGDRPLPVDRVAVAVLALTALALAARLVDLGARSLHWDEARVGYWSLRYLATGAFEYRPVAGGPLLYHVQRAVFGVFGATDATARVAVAVVGGCSPLAALLFRRRLDDAETVGLAALLAASPVLVYYGRFLRGDVPLAAFGLVAVGAAVRLCDGEREYRYLLAVALALALSASGLAVGYLVCWLGAAALTLDQGRLVAEGPTVRRRLAAAVGTAADRWRTAVGPVAALLGLLVLAYAPRSREGVDLWTPATAPAAIREATVGSARAFYGVRVAGRRQGGTHELVPYLAAHAETLAAASLAVLALAVAGFLADRYGTGRSRPLVAFAGYWAGLSLFVFPLIAEESGPWLTVHTVAPSAVPAAAAVGMLLRYAGSALDRDDAVGAAVGLLLVLAVAGQVGVALGDTAYGPTTAANPVVHDAQPGDDLDPFLADVTAATANNEGVDVLFYGSTFVSSVGSNPDRPPVGDAWGNRLPLSWYVERAGAETAGVPDVERLAARGREPPPVVVADPSARSTLESRLPGYEVSVYRLSLWNREAVVFVRR